MELINNVQKRETTSIFERDGRKFQINSYDPIEGNYILVQIISFVLPFGIGDLLEKEVGSEVKANSKTELKPMPKEDFIQLQKDILKTIYEVYDSGNKSPVVRDNGTYGISDVSMQLFIELIIASLAFNFKDFFGGEGSLKQLLQALA